MNGVRLRSSTALRIAALALVFLAGQGCNDQTGAKPTFTSSPTESTRLDNDPTFEQALIDASDFGPGWVDEPVTPRDMGPPDPNVACDYGIPVHRDAVAAVRNDSRAIRILETIGRPANGSKAALNAIREAVEECEDHPYLEIAEDYAEYGEDSFAFRQIYLDDYGTRLHTTTLIRRHDLLATVSFQSRQPYIHDGDWIAVADQRFEEFVESLRTPVVPSSSR